MQAAGSRYVSLRHVNDIIRLWVLGDWHIGNRDARLGLLQRHLDEIRDDPNSYWVGLGDYADCISPTDKRFDSTTIDDDISIRDTGRLGKVLTDKVMELMKPVANKCVGLAYGNHEWKYMRDQEQQDLHAYLCTSLSVPNLGYSFLLDVIAEYTGAKHWVPGVSGVGVATRTDSKMTASRGDAPRAWRVRIYGHHGAGGAATFGGKANRLERFMNYFDANLYLCAHVHEEMARPKVRIGANSLCTKILEEPSLGIITGSYLKSYGQGEHAGYFERWGGAPSFLGAAIVEIDVANRRLSSSLGVTFEEHDEGDAE